MTVDKKIPKLKPQIPKKSQSPNPEPDGATCKFFAFNRLHCQELLHRPKAGILYRGKGKGDVYETKFVHSCIGIAWFVDLGKLQIIGNSFIFCWVGGPGSFGF